MLPLGHSWGHGQEMLIFAKLTGFEGHLNEMILRRLQSLIRLQHSRDVWTILDNLGHLFRFFQNVLVESL